MNAGWIVPFIIIGGALQSCGAAMNSQLNKHVVNPWLASAISFALITFFFAGASLIHPTPLPTQKELADMHWWAVLGGLVGAVQVYAGLTLVNKVGAGPFVGFTVTAALITSLMIDHFQNAGASAEPWPYHWRSSAGWGNQSHCQVLTYRFTLVPYTAPQAVKRKVHEAGTRLLRNSDSEISSNPME